MSVQHNGGFLSDIILYYSVDSMLLPLRMLNLFIPVNSNVFVLAACGGPN